MVTLVVLQASKWSPEVSSKILNKTASATSSSVLSEDQRSLLNNNPYALGGIPNSSLEKAASLTSESISMIPFEEISTAILQNLKNSITSEHLQKESFHDFFLSSCSTQQ